MGWVKGFFLFWYDFLVGDSIVLAIGGPLVLALGYGLVQVHAEVVAQIVLPLAAVATLLLSLPELRRR
jgi:hypothetical protein